MRVLLLGGTGFLGGHVARALSARDNRVCALSRSRKPAGDGIEHLTADRRDPASLVARLAGRRFDATVDFTAFDAADIESVFRVRDVALGRYILISSGQVYLVTRGARPPYREADGEGALIAEPLAQTPDHREWLYGVGKRAAEASLLTLGASRALRTTILRLPIVLGEADGTLRLWAYLERMLDGGPLLLPDGGRRETRFVYAGDVARAVLSVLEGEPRASVYNLAQPDIITLRELLAEVARGGAFTPRFVEVSWEELERGGLERSFSPYAGPWASILDPSAAASDWGFAGTPPRAYLPAVVGWHLEHRPDRSHPGYAQRSRELEIAARLESRMS
jgi:nucleoside-diphosphate-sugar epimerase